MQGAKITDAKIIAALKQANGLITHAAKKLRCNPDTIHQRIKDSPAVAAVVKGARDVVLDDAESSLHKAVKKKEAWAVTFTLRTIGRERGYLDRTEVKHTGAVDHNHALPDPERVARIVALLAAARERRAAASPGPSAAVVPSAGPADRGV
jgi:hypothetical protein